MQKNLKAAIAGMALIVISASTPSHAQEMKGEAIKSAVSGKTFTYSGPSTGTVSYNADGSTPLTFTSKGKQRTKGGTWKVKGDKLCTTRVRKGSKGKQVEECASIKLLDAGKMQLSNGYFLTPK